MAPGSSLGHMEIDTLLSSRLANGAPAPGQEELSDGCVVLVITVNHSRAVRVTQL